MQIEKQPEVTEEGKQIGDTGRETLTEEHKNFTKYSERNLQNDLHIMQSWK